jgi:hypothetical protein
MKHKIQSQEYEMCKKKLKYNFILIMHETYTWNERNKVMMQVVFQTNIE